MAAGSYYQFLHDMLLHILLAAKSCWPEADRAPLSKRGAKYGGIKRNDKLTTMALAGVLAQGYDGLTPWERFFLRQSDEWESGMITAPELHARLTSYRKSTGVFSRKRFFVLKHKIIRKVARLRKIPLK